MSRTIYVLTSTNEDGDTVVLGAYNSLAFAQKMMRKHYDFEIFDAKESGYEDVEEDSCIQDTIASVYRSAYWTTFLKIHETSIAEL